MSSKFVSRRAFLKGVAATAGAALGTRFGGRGLEGEARADAGKPALVMVYLHGGYNAFFGAADGLQGKFGVSASNIESLGNGLVVDKPTLGSLSPLAKTRMATIGVSHGLTSHDDNQMQKWWSFEGKSYALQLAAALGGDGAIKAAVVGRGRIPGPRPAESGVSLQSVLDMEATLSALGAPSTDPRPPSRDIAASILQRCAEMSKDSVAGSPGSLSTLRDAYPTANAVLKRAPTRVTFAELSKAYGLGASTQVKSFASQIAAAELLITAGANVVVAVDDDDFEGWDSHGVIDGTNERQMMSSRIIPPLKTLLDRTLDDPNFNVTVAIVGDFARSLPDSDHQPSCAVTVIGKNVKTGTTGRVDGNVNMPSGTPDVRQMWSYLASVLKAPANPFGANPHDLVR